MDLLKREGPRDARSLAGQLGVTAMAVRQHLYDLQDEKLVTHRAEPRPVGRPAKLWQLTEAAGRFYPDGHAALTVELLGALGQAFGAGGVERLVQVRARQQVDSYKKRLPRRASLARRLQALADVRTEEGYMAEVITGAEGSLLLVENHCPICTAASACTGLCAAELEVFQKVLGDAVKLERTEHIVEGARRCVYRVEKA